MNLDALWSRARTTVTENTRRIKRTLRFSSVLGLEGPFTQDGPYPCNDHCGYEIALPMLINSQRPGRNDPTHVQFDTVKKLRTSYCSHMRATPKHNLAHRSLVDNKGKYVRFAEDKGASLWFNRFMMGLKARLGSTWKPNKAMSHELLKEFLYKIEQRIDSAEHDNERHDWIVFAAYVTISYVISLRGNEGTMLELRGLRRHWKDDKTKHFIIVLFGKLKGEDSHRDHLIPCINTTNSRIRVKHVVQRLIEVKETLGFFDGPAISDSKGFVYTTKQLDTKVHEILLEIFEEDKNLFPPSISSSEDILDSYKCNRTFRRSSDTRALEKKVDSQDINLVNRWEQATTQQSKKYSQPMKQHYAQFELLLNPFLRYTSEM